MSNEFAIPSLPQKKPLPFPPLSYEKPSWSGIASFNYRLEVLKNGSSLETIQGPKKDLVTLGRLPICDIPMEHPSISRYHAVIQFDQEGDAYIYDMDSAHGTRLNKKVIPSREYISLKPGDQLRFGESTRICIFDSEKPYDPEAEAEERQKLALRQKIAKAKGEESIDANGDDGGISWGFGEDAESEEEEEEVEDDIENDVQRIEAGLDRSGDAGLLNIEAEKMAIEDQKRRRQDLEIMYNNDSDEELYDKTKKKKKKVDKAETHDELVKRQQLVLKEIEKIEQQMKEKKADTKEKEKEEEQDLDTYMNFLNKKPQHDQDKSLFTLQKELVQLKKDNDRLVKLVKLTKPSDIL